MVREKIKKVMELKNIHVCKLAVECGIHNTSIYSFLSGQRGLSYDHLEKVMSCLGLTLVPKKSFHFHSDYLEEKERKRQERIAAKRNE